MRVRGKRKIKPSYRDFLKMDKKGEDARIDVNTKPLFALFKWTDFIKICGNLAIKEIVDNRLKLCYVIKSAKDNLSQIYISKVWW